MLFFVFEVIIPSFYLASISSSVETRKSLKDLNKYLMFCKYFSTLDVLYNWSFLLAGWEMLMMPLRKGRKKLKSRKAALWSDCVRGLYLYHPALSSAGRRARIMKM